MKLLKKIGAVVGVLLLAIVSIIFWHVFQDSGNKYARPEFDETQIPMFEKHTLDYTTYFEAKSSLPVIGSAVFDINNDGKDELLVGNGVGHEAGIFTFINGKFKNISEQVNFKKVALDQPMYGVATVDIDKDGYTDLLIAFQSAVFVYLNDNGEFLPPLNLNLNFNPKSQPLSITYTDLNEDGYLDLFVSTYLHKNQMEGQTIFNKDDYGSTSELFINNGDNTFKKSTQEWGLNYIHNTFTAVFADINNDNLSDLVVAYDTGEPRIYKNTGNKTFELLNQPLTGKFSYPMGIAVGDYDQNGFQDFMFSNVGKSLPSAMVKGDLKKDQVLVTDWILLSNQGNNTFSDNAVQAKIANYEFSWGAVFEDFNNDGLQDLVVSENYVDLPNSKIKPLPSRFLLQLPNHTFVNVENDNQTINPCNGITPLAGDFNGDGWADLAHINLDGDITVFINKKSSQNRFITLRLPNTLEYAQAKIHVAFSDGTNQYYQNIIGEGLASDQHSNVFIGLKNKNEIPKITLYKRNGEKSEIHIEAINTVIQIRDDSTLEK